jgi:hypothetical protein
MGNSKSKSSQAITNNTVNQNYMESLNKTIMNSAVETMINNASSCSSAVNLNNSCDLSNTKISGDFTFGGNQTAQAKVNFNCIQANKTSTDMSTSMIASMVAEMKSLNGTEAAANLNTAAETSNKSGFISMPSSSNANSSTTVNNNVTNETISTVQNIFEQNLSNNFSVNTVNECIGKTSVSNSQDLSNMTVGGNAKIECIQTASVEQVQNCKQLSESIQKTTQSTLQELGLVVETENTTTNDTTSTVTSKSENVSTGPIEEVGNAVGGILDSIGLAFLAPFISPICAICCVLIFLVVGFKLFGMFSSGNDGFGSGIDMSGVNGFGSGMNIPGANEFIQPPIYSDSFASVNQ